MRWDTLEDEQCSLARTVAVIGDRWSLLVLRECFLRVRRFEEFQSRLSITRHLLADRLKKFVKFGVLRKVKYQDRPVRYEYILTQRGLDLYPIVMSIVHWGDTHMVDERGRPLLHRAQEWRQGFRSRHDLLGVRRAAACQRSSHPPRPRARRSRLPRARHNSRLRSQGAVSRSTAAPARQCSHRNHKRQQQQRRRQQKRRARQLQRRVCADEIGEVSVNRNGPTSCGHAVHADGGALQLALLIGRDQPRRQRLAAAPGHAPQRHDGNAEPGQQSGRRSAERSKNPIAPQPKPSISARRSPRRRTIGPIAAPCTTIAQMPTIASVAPTVAGVPAVAIGRVEHEVRWAARHARAARRNSPPKTRQHAVGAQQMQRADRIGALPAERRAAFLRQRLRQDQPAVQRIGKAQTRRDPERQPRIDVAEQAAERRDRG